MITGPRDYASPLLCEHLPALHHIDLLTFEGQCVDIVLDVVDTQGRAGALRGEDKGVTGGTLSATLRGTLQSGGG